MDILGNNAIYNCPYFKVYAFEKFLYIVLAPLPAFPDLSIESAFPNAIAAAVAVTVAAAVAFTTAAAVSRPTARSRALPFARPSAAHLSRQRFK